MIPKIFTTSKGILWYPNGVQKGVPLPGATKENAKEIAAKAYGVPIEQIVNGNMLNKQSRKLNPNPFGNPIVLKVACKKVLSGQEWLDNADWWMRTIYNKIIRLNIVYKKLARRKARYLFPQLSQINKSISQNYKDKCGKDKETLALLEKKIAELKQESYKIYQEVYKNQEYKDYTKILDQNKKAKIQEIRKLGQTPHEITGVQLNEPTVAKIVADASERFVTIDGSKKKVVPYRFRTRKEPKQNIVKLFKIQTARNISKPTVGVLLDGGINGFRFEKIESYQVSKRADRDGLYHVTMEFQKGFPVEMLVRIWNHPDRDILVNHITFVRQNNVMGLRICLEPTRSDHKIFSRKTGSEWASINFGWSQMEAHECQVQDCGQIVKKYFHDIRVCFVRKQNGEMIEFRIPYTYFKDQYISQDKQGCIDDAINQLRTWLVNHKSELPEGVQKQLSFVDKWRSPEKFFDLFWNWTDNLKEFKGFDHYQYFEEVYRSIKHDFDAKKGIDKRLMRWIHQMDGEFGAMLRRVTPLKEIGALNTLYCGQIGTLIMDNSSMKDLATKSQGEKHNATRHATGAGHLRESLKTSSRLQIVDADHKNNSRKCRFCDHLHKSQKLNGRIVTCNHCGKEDDVDKRFTYNALVSKGIMPQADGNLIIVKPICKTVGGKKAKQKAKLAL